MTTRGVDFLKNWISTNVTGTHSLRGNHNLRSLSQEMSERLIFDAERAGFLLDDLQPEFGTPEELIREALELAGAPLEGKKP